MQTAEQKHKKAKEAKNRAERQSAKAAISEETAIVASELKVSSLKNEE